MAALNLHDIAAHMKKIDFGMLATRGAGGGISTRPMSNNGDVEYDGDSWFFSFDDTRKVADIKNAPKVAVTFSGKPGLFGKPGIFIAIEGEAFIETDKNLFRKHWVDGLERWFAEGIETPGLVLIGVHATRIEYWDGEESDTVALGQA